MNLAEVKYSFENKDRLEVIKDIKSIGKSIENVSVKLSVSNYTDALAYVHANVQSKGYAADLDKMILLLALLEAELVKGTINGFKKKNMRMNIDPIKMSVVDCTKNITIRGLDSSLNKVTKLYIHIDTSLKLFSDISSAEESISNTLRDTFISLEDKNYYPIITPYVRLRNQDINFINNNETWTLLRSILHRFMLLNDYDVFKAREINAIKLTHRLVKYINENIIEILY